MKTKFHAARLNGAGKPIAEMGNAALELFTDGLKAQLTTGLTLSSWHASAGAHLRPIPNYLQNKLSPSFS